MSRIDGVKTDLGCGCVDVGFENPAAIRKFLFQSSTSRYLMLKVRDKYSKNVSKFRFVQRPQGDTS